MSIAALSLAFYHSKATNAQRLVLFAIANFDGENGAWPAQETISRLSGGLNRRTVQRAIEELVSMGELEAVERPGRTNVYSVKITCPDTCDRSQMHREKGGGLQTAGGSQTAGGAVSTPHEPLKNQIYKNKGSRVDIDFKPGEHLLEWAKTNGINFDLESETQKFIDYYQSLSGAKAVRADWDASWRNWMRNVKSWAKSPIEKAKESQAQESRQKLATEKEWTKQYLEESKKAAETATAPPKCQHGESIVRCTKCLPAVS